MSRRPTAPKARTAPGPAVLHQAIIRPDHEGRTHPDPRADPPTEILDPAGTRTTELREVGTDTDRFPVVRLDLDPDTDPGLEPVGDPDTSRLPVVTTEPGPGRPDGRPLVVGTLVGALAGLVSWVVAARLLPAAAVGEAQLVVSALLLVGGLTHLDVAARRAARFGWGALLLVVPLCGLAGLGCALLTPGLAALAAGPGAPPALGVVTFALACAAWAVLAVHDDVLVAAGRPWWAVGSAGLFAVVRIGALVALAGMAGLGAHGVVLSWAGPAVVWAVLGSAAVAVLTRAPGAGTADAAPQRPARAAAVLAPAAAAQLGVVLLHHQVPIVVNLRFGPETAAAFLLAWQAVVVVELVAAAVVHARPAMARRRLLLLFLPALALCAALAGPLLGLLGPAYAEATDILRLLLLGLAFRLLVAHALGTWQALGRGAAVAGLQLLSTVLVSAVAIVVPHAGGGVGALLPVAIGYIVVQVACAAAVLILPAARRTDGEVPAP